MKRYTESGSICGIFVLALAFVALCSFPCSGYSAWKAGAASVSITPEEPVWMGGYGSRVEPSAGVLLDIHAKALALEDGRGQRVVIVTSDLIGFEKESSDRIAARVQKKYGLPRNALLLNSSHTHCGPETRSFKIPFYNFPEDMYEYRDTKIKAYISWLEDRVVEAVDSAISDLDYAVLSFATARPRPFSVSRRRPTDGGIVYRSGPSSYYTGGPRDDTVPVIKVAGSDGSLKAVLFGYACHPITLFEYNISGDYPGFAQKYVEDAVPGAVCLFMQGCCGQLVPNARYQREYAMGHGRTLADAVLESLEGESVPLTGTIESAYEEVVLDFGPISERATLEGQAAGTSSEARKARFLLDRLDKGLPIQTTLDCPLQAMRIGRELLLIGLPGEPVVEWALKFKSEFQEYHSVWVSGYNSHEFGYLPTWQILREGGYEAGRSNENTPFSGYFTESVEKKVSDGVRRLEASVTEKPERN